MKPSFKVQSIIIHAALSGESLPKDEAACNLGRLGRSEAIIVGARHMFSSPADSFVTFSNEDRNRRRAGSVCWHWAATSTELPAVLVLWALHSSSTSSWAMSMAMLLDFLHLRTAKSGDSPAPFTSPALPGRAMRKALRGSQKSELSLEN